MFRDPQTLLEYEVRRNPIVAQLFNDVDRLTETEIQSAKIMPWIKKALTGHKATVDFNATIARTKTQMEGLIVDTFVADPMGETRQWIGEESYISLPRDNQLLMKYGELFWIVLSPPSETEQPSANPWDLLTIDGKGVWIDTIYSQKIDPKLLNNSQSIGRMTRSQYMEAVRELARGQSSLSDQVMSFDSKTQSPLSPLAQYGVKFFR